MYMCFLNALLTFAGLYPTNAVATRIDDGVAINLDVTVKDSFDAAALAETKDRRMPHRDKTPTVRTITRPPRPPDN